MISVLQWVAEASIDMQEAISLVKVLLSNFHALSRLQPPISLLTKAPHST